MFELIDFIIVNPIINILFVIYNYIGDFGVAMIIFTILVKLLTWPLVKKQFLQMKLMRKIQPELTEIRKRCNGNKQLESLQMMDLYKRNNVKPFTSIWTLLIQLPIFFAIFFAIRIMVTPTVKDSVEKRAYPVVAKMTRIDEIIKLQKSYLENAKAGKDMNQADLNSVVSGQMNFMMPVMMIMITINFPGALVMYYLLSNIIAITQQKIVFNQVDEQMDNNTDRAILRELKKKTSEIREAEVIENKKTGTKITRISAKDAKNSSREATFKNKNSQNNNQPDNG